MELKEVLLLGIVLLVSGGNPSAAAAAAQSHFNSSTNETLDQAPQERPPTSWQLPRSPPSNQTAHGDRATPRAAHRFRVYQLRKPAARGQKQMGASQTPQRSEGGGLTSGQLAPGGAARAQEFLKLLVQGPNLNPPFESKVLVKAEQRVPIPAASVAARCGESEVTVEVKRNFLGNGQLIRPSDLTLGGCATLHAADHVLRFQAQLQGCGSTLKMTEDALVYSFSLVYSPTPVGNTVILKTNSAQVVVECHYRRKQHVSSNAVRPTWTPHASRVSAEWPLRFTLRLMTEDWQSQRPSNVFSLSDVMHVEAAVLQGHHVPLRVYADSCVATVKPDPSSQPRYPFVSNHGCLNDGKLTGAKSYFMQRSQEHKLQFQLKAFRFHQDHRKSLYITCHLKATTVFVPVNSQRKACSFLTEASRWVASGGDNEVCRCCETSCGEQRRRRRRLAADAGLPQHLQWEGTASLGPLLLEDSGASQELRPELLPEPASPLQTRGATPAASSSSAALLCGAGAALAVVVLVFVAAAARSRQHKPSGHTVCT